MAEKEYICECGRKMVFQPSQVQYYCAKCQKYKKPEQLLRAVDFSKPMEPRK